MFKERAGYGSAGKISIILAGIIFIGGIIFSGLFSMGLAYTNEMEFCTSCHSMKVNLEEYKETLHYKNASGVQATCSDCHVPKPFIPKMIAKVMAAKDVYHEIMGTIDTREKYEAHRWDMATRVWEKMRASDSRECRSCHEFTNMDLSEQDRSARKRHPKAMDEGKACIDCHKGVAHEEPDEPEEEEEETDES
ncbi:MAG: cytochrome C [gamma proteobacterium symbiont of Ctena orbiculata]|nr:MAG: cytochrome C [gamma proteobacterium symbiont of Ctena orbiculata]